MINWLKQILGVSPAPKAEPVPEVPAAKLSDAPAVKAKKVATTKAKGNKTTSKTKTATTKTKESTKRGRKKTGITKTDLNKMTKDDLETFAKKEFKVDIDKRKKKADLVDEVLNLSKKS